MISSIVREFPFGVLDGWCGVVVDGSSRKIFETVGFLPAESETVGLIIKVFDSA